MLIFEVRAQGREPTTKLNPHNQDRESNPGHIGGYPLHLNFTMFSIIYQQAETTLPQQCILVERGRVFVFCFVLKSKVKFCTP